MDTTRKKGEKGGDGGEKKMDGRETGFSQTEDAIMSWHVWYSVKGGQVSGTWLYFMVEHGAKSRAEETLDDRQNQLEYWNFISSFCF